MCPWLKKVWYFVLWLWNFSKIERMIKCFKCTFLFLWSQNLTFSISGIKFFTKTNYSPMPKILKMLILSTKVLTFSSTNAQKDRHPIHDTDALKNQNLATRSCTRNVMGWMMPLELEGRIWSHTHRVPP